MLKIVGRLKNDKAANLAKATMGAMLVAQAAFCRTALAVHAYFTQKEDDRTHRDQYDAQRIVSKASMLLFVSSAVLLRASFGVSLMCGF